MKSLIPNEPTKCSIFAKLKENLPGIDVGAVKLSMQLASLSQQSLQVFENHFSQWGLSQGRFAILMLLFNLPEKNWTPATLAEATGVTKATITGLLNNLTRDGHVERQPHESDRRKTCLKLSEPGKALVQELIPAHFSKISSYYEHLSAKEIKQITESLELLQRTMNSITENQ